MKILQVGVWLGGQRTKNWEGRLCELMRRQGHEVVFVPYPRWVPPHHEPDVVFASHHMAVGMAYHLAERHRAKFVAQVLDFPAFRFSEPWSRNLERFVGISVQQYRKEWEEIVECLRKADLVISISKTTAKDLKDHFGIDSVVNYLGVDVEMAETANQHDQSSYRRAEQYVCIGNLYDHKRFDIPVGVFSKIGKRLVVMGEGYMRKTLEEMAGPNIVFTGAVTDEQKFRILRRSMGLVHSSMHEGFGIILAEAGYVGIPAIVYDIPVFREVYEDSPIYWHGKDELVKILQEDDPEFLKSKGEQLKRAILKKELTLQACSKRLLRLFDSVL